MELASKATSEITKIEAGGGLNASVSADVGAILGQMQDRFINDASNDEFISTCLVELGGAPYGAFERDGLVSVINAYWVYANSPGGYFSEDYRNSDHDLIVRLQTALVDRFNYSSLADLCWNILPDHVTQQQRNRMILAEFNAEVNLIDSKTRLNSAKNQGINSFKGAIEACTKIDDASRTAQCVNVAIQLAGGLKSRGAQAGPRATILPIIAFKEAERLYPLFTVEKNKLAAITLSLSPTAGAIVATDTEEIQAQKNLQALKASELAKTYKRLLKNKSELTSKLIEVDSQVKKLVKAAEEQNIEDLQATLPGLQGDYATENRGVDKDRIAAQIALQQAEARAIEARYDDLSKALRGNTSAANDLEKGIVQYNKDVTDF